MTPKEKAETLKNWMKEFFPFAPLLKAGFFTKEMRGDYEAQAQRVCKFFGFKSVYEYGKDEIKCHISEANPSPDKPFVTLIPSVWD